MEITRVRQVAQRAEDLISAMHACGARYPVTTTFDELRELDPSWGLLRVYASAHMADRLGHALQGAGSPAISVWELPPPKRDDSGPQMLPR